MATFHHHVFSGADVLEAVRVDHKGIKVSRWIVFFRTVRRELNESFSPR